MNSRIGFIGAGMMAEAIVKGLLASGMDAACVTVADPDDGRREFFTADLGIPAVDDNKRVAESSVIIVIATKPHTVKKALKEIGSLLRTDQLVISIAAGTTIAAVESAIGCAVPVIRAMPNTPALIGEGVTAIAPGTHAEARHMDAAAEVFGAVGKVVRTTEDKMDAVTGLSGSGPAYVYTLIEALADGGVQMGLPKAASLVLAAQTVAGAARMVLETGEHPAQLRDRVMTPGGTTIAGIAALERRAFRSSLIDAVAAATERAREMSKLAND